MQILFNFNNDGEKIFLALDHSNLVLINHFQYIASRSAFSSYVQIWFIFCQIAADFYIADLVLSL